MIVTPLLARIYVCVLPTDMRNGMDGLCGIVRSGFKLEPTSGDLFVFRNRRGHMLKILYWCGDGFAVWYKHLQQGTFKLPAASGNEYIEIDSVTLSMILEGIDLRSVRRLRRFTKKTA